MASATNLEERFNKAVQTIQNLPPNGVIQPSNLTKLIFYGLYKQATLGPCQESQPSMFNYVARAKWEAWARCRAMTKEQAMREYIDEIRKIIETMPQTSEVLAFAKSMGLAKENDPVPDVEIPEHQTTNDNPPISTNDSTQVVVVAAAGNDSLPSSSLTSSSSISSSDLDEFYDDPSDLLSNEIASDQHFQQQITNTTGLHPPSHVHGDQTGATIPVRHSTRGGHNHSNAPSTRPPLFRPPNPNHGVQYSTSSIASGGNGAHHPTNTYNNETQHTILTALMKLQRDVQNISERLNRLETSATLLGQRPLSSSKELASSSKWFPLSGFRRGAIAFILLWPFLAYALIRLYLRAIIIIRFRR